MRTPETDPSPAAHTLTRLPMTSRLLCAFIVAWVLLGALVVTAHAAPAMTLSLNQSTFRTGGTLRVGLKAQNPGPAVQADFYFGVLLPDGITLFFFTGLSPINGVVTRLDANPKTFQTLVSNILIPQGLDVTIDDILVLTFPANFPPGTYIFFTLLTPPSVFTDGRVDTGDILVIDAKSLSFGPSMMLAEGNFWEYMWTMTSTTASPDGTSTDVDSGRFIVTLGAPGTIAGETAFPLIVTGKSVDADKFDYAPNWTHLAVVNNRILGSKNGTTLAIIFDADASWQGGGYFDALTDRVTYRGTAGSIDNEFIKTTAIVVSRAENQTFCEIIEGRDVCPNDTSFTLIQREYFKGGIGPIGYSFFLSALFEGGGFTTTVTRKRTLGLVRTDRIGDDGFTATGPPWNDVAPMPTARDNLSAAVVNGMIYAIGGRTHATFAMNTVEAYDPTTDTWRTKTAMPTARTQHSSVAIDGIIYVLGGHDAKGAYLTSVEAYNPVTDKWMVLPPLAQPRAEHASCVLENHLVLIIGGDQALGNYPTQVLLYDILSGQTRQTKGGLTSGQFRTTCAAVAGRIFAVGELDTSVQKFLGTNHELDLTDGTWKLRRSMPTGRADAAAASVGGIMYVVGGFNFSQQQRVVEAYNPVADAWTTKKSMQRPRDAPAAAVVNGLIYVMGGMTGTNTITNAVEVYDPARDQ